MNSNPLLENYRSIPRTNIPEPEVEYIATLDSSHTEEILVPRKVEYLSDDGKVVEVVF